MTIIELSNKLDVTIPDFINDYSNHIENITSENLDDIESIVEYNCYQDHVSEHADSSTPHSYYNIDNDYTASEYTIDDAIDEGLVSPMTSEADIYKAKQVAIYMGIVSETYEEIREFISSINSELSKLSEKELEALC